MDSLIVGGQFGLQAVQTSCALALLGTCCTASKSACRSSVLLCQETAPQQHCAHDPTQPGEGGCTLQMLDALLSALCCLLLYRTVGSQFCSC